MLNVLEIVRPPYIALDMRVKYLEPVILCRGCFALCGFEFGKDKTLDLVAEH